MRDGEQPQPHSQCLVQGKVLHQQMHLLVRNLINRYHHLHP